MPARTALTFCLLTLSFAPAAGASEPARAPVANVKFPADGKVDFVRDVQPILQASCVECHNADNKKGRLRLDARSFATKGGQSGDVLAAGKPADSLLLRRVRGEGGEKQMPFKRPPLPAEQVRILAAWIEQGAAWPDGVDGVVKEDKPHWSFVKPVRPEPPHVKNRGWVRNPIDAFVLARLEREGLDPSPEAGKVELLRRVTFDLIGLPPTPAEIDAFLADTSAGAYERVVDRLLTSPHYGERFARQWLDLARYADTNGYEKDRPRNIWPYRDWVIDALNRDVPFDRFTIEQIAGDLLPDATPEQLVATGFHRNTLWNEEGGIDTEEFRFKAVVDRVETTGKAWLGLTLQCAQCHNHKYDPFTQKEYFGVYAMLNNADEPEYEIPDAKVAARRAEVEKEVAELGANLEREFPNSADLPKRLAEWEQQAAAKVGRWTVVRPAKMASRGMATLAMQDDGSVLVSGDWPNNDVYSLELATELSGVTAIKLEVLPDPSLPENGPGRAPLFMPGDFLLSEFELKAGPLNGAEPVAVKPVKASHSFASPKRAAEMALDGRIDTGWSIGPKTGQAHQAVFVLPQPVGGESGTRLLIDLVSQYIHQTTIGRFRISVTTDAAPAPAGELPPDVEAILATTKPEQRTAEQQARLKAHFLSVAPELSAQHRRIADLRKSMPPYQRTLVMRERSPEHPRVTRLLHRGEYLQPRDPVSPAVPALLHPLPAGAPANRLGLAKWLVDEGNPLVGRVVMNRAWATFFGRGIVNTVEDFGLMGEAPSHPELLDWLATEFPRRGWSMKALHRLIVTSATYRQGGRVTPELLARDPGNVLLARGPRNRVEAEMVRDLALSVGGLLDARVGGPSVFPPQPEGVIELSYGATPWPTSKGGDRWRRGLYTYLKRTSPYPAMLTFDAPTSDFACVRRVKSNTPLQALTLLNDQVFVEASQALARRVLKESPAGADVASRMRLAFRFVTGREADADELAELTRFYDAQLARFKDGSADAKAVAASDVLPAPEGANLPELAAWTVTARALLNLDETITK